MESQSIFAMQVYKDVMTMHPKNHFVGCCYIKIDKEDNATFSAYPYGCEDAKNLVLFCNYEYPAGERGFNEKTFYAIFIDENRNVNDCLNIGNWKIMFSAPIQQYYHTNNHKLLITNDTLGINTYVSFSYSHYAKEFCEFWSYLKIIVQQTNADIVEFIIKQFNNKIALDEEILQNLYLKAQQERNAEIISQYQLLLSKIDTMINSLSK